MSNLRARLKEIQRLINETLDEHDHLSDMGAAFVRSLIQADDADDFLIGSSGDEEPLSLGDGPEVELEDNDRRIAGFEFTVEPVIRYGADFMSIISNRNNPVIPPSVTAVPGQPDTYLDDTDADTVYRFMPVNEVSDQGYVFVYYRKKLHTIIEGFNRCGGFRKEI